jgi:hypothetical protein
VVTTDEEIDAAIARAASLADEPRATSIAYRPGLDVFVVMLSNGERMVLQRELLQGLQDGTKRQLANVEITPQGSGLHWPDLDVDLYVPSLLRHIYGTKQWMSKIGRLGGAARTPAKAEASRVNGSLGGRPKRAMSR